MFLLLFLSIYVKSTKDDSLSSFVNHRDRTNRGARPFPDAEREPVEVKLFLQEQLQVAEVLHMRHARLFVMLMHG
jgi:hypothetical protein